MPPGISPLPGQAPAGYVIVALPGEVDLLNASAVSDLLLTAVNGGAAGVIADMTRTRFCDVPGCAAVARAGKRARLLGSWVQAVVPDPFVRKVLRLTSADQAVPVCVTWDDALAARACASVQQPGPGIREAGLGGACLSPDLSGTCSGGGAGRDQAQLGVSSGAGGAGLGDVTSGLVSARYRALKAGHGYGRHVRAAGNAGLQDIPWFFRQLMGEGRREPRADQAGERLRPGRTSSAQG